MSIVLDYIKRRPNQENNACFVIMPFNDRRTAVYQHSIRPAIEKAGLRCIRADELLSSTPILFDIYEAILSARVVLADISEPNANVYYELGIGHALKRNVILICEENMPLPFDIGGIRHISYRNDPEGSAALREALSRAIRFLTEQPGNLHSESKLALEKAHRLWSKAPPDMPGEITISQEHFVEAVLTWDEIEVTQEQASFLAHAAAYYGKLMRIVTERVKSNRLAIAALIREVASGTTTRVPWRASAMLEEMDSRFVAEEAKKYQGRVRNSIFPNSFQEKTTQQLLYQAMIKDGGDKGEMGKLNQTLKQIVVEFGTSHRHGRA